MGSILGKFQLPIPVNPERLKMWRGALRGKDPKGYLEMLAAKGIRVLIPEDDEYPALLREIYDAPPVIFVKGKRLPSQEEFPYVGIVGSRKCSEYGREVAMSLSRSLAEREVVIVSGAAYGVDGWAHRGCLEAGGFTVAVLGCGVDVSYPAFHRDLLEEMCEKGAVISEYPPGTEPAPWRFPHRNRIIAGLCHFLVVVEAAERSGALITAQLALEEGREVGAVPGPVNSPFSVGTNALIQKGAKLIRAAEDVVEEFPPHLRRSYLQENLHGVFLEPIAGGWVHPRSSGPSALSEGKASQAGAGGGGSGRRPLLEGGRLSGKATTDDIGGGILEKSGKDLLDKTEKEIIEELARGPKGLDQLMVLLGMPAGDLLSCLVGLKVRGLVKERAGGLFALAAPTVAYGGIGGV